MTVLTRRRPGGPLRCAPRLLAALLLIALFIAPARTSPRAGYARLEAQLRPYAQSAGEEVFLYFEDLTTGTAIGFRDREPVPAGSTVKVPLVLFLYTLARDHKIDLEESMPLLPEDFEETDETWAPGPRPPTLRELAISALKESDNVAANALIRRLGRGAFYDFLNGLGVLVPPMGPGEANLTSARDVATWFKALIRFRDENPSLDGAPLKFLYDTPFNSRMVAYLPWDVPVAHKVGTFRNVVADAGIVFLPGRPYLLAVFVRHRWRDEEDERAAERTIAEISLIVYAHQARLAGG